MFRNIRAPPPAVVSVHCTRIFTCRCNSVSLHFRIQVEQICNKTAWKKTYFFRSFRRIAKNDY